ncbi:MAG: hypothetical protein H6809_01030 [Phycisphaeraceae bacterium]|nr:hypothetical protein [Phycisphaeraceae bacterium]
MTLAHLTVGVAAAALPDYQLVGSFPLPTGVNAYDVLPDGRALAIVGASIYAQDALHSPSFSVIGSVPGGTVSSFGASFLRVNPSGTRVAIGDNEFGPGAEVFVFNPAALSTASPVPGSTYPIDNFDAHWAGDDTLYVTGGNFTETLVTRLDAGSGAFGTVVNSVGGASGGVTTDATYLYTANGFSFTGPSATGDIRAFPLAALAPGSPLNFETQGSPVASVLSGNTLGFDSLGNLLVGGGLDTFAAVVDGIEVLAAASGGPPATTLLELSPTGATDSHFVRLNPATGELLVTAFADSTVYRYAIVPAPGTLVLLGVLAIGRRRRG